MKGRRKRERGKGKEAKEKERKKEEKRKKTKIFKVQEADIHDRAVGLLCLVGLEVSQFD